nr:MAG TPA: hypothetical protein [Bacteriophage sp.]
MDVKKIKKILGRLNEVIEEESPTNAEFILSVANLLRVFSIAHIVVDPSIPKFNYNDSFEVESMCLNHPDNFGLQLMLQVHVLIKMSERFSKSPEIEK